MNKPIITYPITHAHIVPFDHPTLGATISGRSVVRYLRFLRPVTIDRLELKPVVYGRWTPDVPTHPAHLIISTLDPKSLQWQVVKEVDLPADPRISGKGLSQSMSEDEMIVHFQKVMKTTRTHAIKLNGLQTRVLRVECDREHPVWPSHGEINANVHSVPFGALDSLKVFGPEPSEAVSQASYYPILTRGTVKPSAPTGMSVRQIGEMVYYESKYFSAGFSLRRPVMQHMGWDVLGKGLGATNRLAFRRPRPHDVNHGISGPMLIAMDQDCGSHRWTVRVDVKGDRVIYRDLSTIPGVTIDAVFTLNRRGMEFELIQTGAANVPVLEAEAWRFTFALSRGITGVAAVPTELPGRAGDVEVPAMICGAGNGALSITPNTSKGNEARLQVESYRFSYELTAGLSLCPRPEAGQSLHIAKGTMKSSLRLEVANFEPRASNRKAKPGLGIQRHWASNFACFRPEWAGFSNNSASCNCHVNQNGPIEMAVFTKKPKNGPDPLRLVKFTIGRALMDGSGYGYWRNLYKDSDPMLITSAGRIHQIQPDMNWLAKVQPGLECAAKRMLGDLDRKTGLIICKDLTGNTNSFRWSSNAWDIVGFGHLDAYVNAFSYRAMKNAVTLFTALKQDDLADRCGEAAASIRSHYAKHFVNPKTGWVVCWKSRDGQLHDYASPWVNGPACAFGLLDRSTAKRALTNLETLRNSLGIGSACYGVPFMMKPIHPGDHMMQHKWDFGKTEPTFELFTDGSMGTSAVTYYLRALSIHGLKKQAKAMASDIDRSLAEGLFSGGYGNFGEGREFLSWEGLPSGYEGTFGLTFGVLYAIAIEQGIFSPPSPEWWPE